MFPRFFVLVFFLSFGAYSVAGELVNGFLSSLESDAQYQAARAEFEVGQIEARRAGRAYWPEMGISYGERYEGGGSQRTVQISQSLFNSDKMTTWLGSDSLDFRALATMKMREVDLAQRYLSAVSELVRAREGIELNKRKTDAIQLQARATQRAFELGTGTITDQRDTQVRLDQARAEGITLVARLAAAERQYQAITGSKSSTGGYVLSRAKHTLVLPSIEQLKEMIQVHNPGLVIARQNLKLADLDVWRKRGAFLPQANLVAKTTTVANGLSSNYVGLSLSLPIQANGLLNIDAAKANAQKATSEVLAAEQKAQLEIERLHALVDTGQLVANIRLQAIESARLSLESNEKSFQGGFRSMLDVLNSIQTLHQVQDEYVGSKLDLANNLLALHSLAGASPVREVLTFIEGLLF